MKKSIKVKGIKNLERITQLKIKAGGCSSESCTGTFSVTLPSGTVITEEVKAVSTDYNVNIT